MKYNLAAGIFISCVLAPFFLFSQEVKPPVPDGTQGEVFTPEMVDSTGTEIKKMKLNEFDGPLSTLKFGGGFLIDYAGFSQDEVSKEQITTESNFKVRDARFILSGKFKTKREITWKVGLMYEGNDQAWYTRETGIMFKLPEIYGHVFLGRTKEGYSFSKIMNGYSGWSLERAAAIDAIPILADGIKYMGYMPKKRIFLNVGAFVDWVSAGQGFSTYQYQFVTRLAYLPIYKDVYKPVLHIGANYRYGKIKNGEIRVRSRPEVSGSPFYVDSETFPADYSTSLGGEIYFRSNKFLFCTEYHVHMFNSPEKDNPVFMGGEAFVAYVFTGEIKPYYTSSGIFGFIKVNKSVFDGGPGAWEGVLRISNYDVEDALITGGEFWRITPTVNWYLSDNVRLSGAYGYCLLDRFEKEGASNIFQGRLLFML